MEFLLLGPLEVRQGGSAVRLAGTKQRALLSILLLHANEVVSRDLLLDALWPDDPAGRRTASSSRSRASRPSSGLVVPAGRCALWSTGPDRRTPVRAAARRGPACERQGDPAGALEFLRDALALWRGRRSDLAYGRPPGSRSAGSRSFAWWARADRPERAGARPGLVRGLESLVALHLPRAAPAAPLALTAPAGGRARSAST
jgi:hypothetical protein